MRIARKRITTSKGHDILWPNDFIGDFLFITINRYPKPYDNETYLFMGGDGLIKVSYEPFFRKLEPSRHHIFKQI